MDVHLPPDSSPAYVNLFSHPQLIRGHVVRSVEIGQTPDGRAVIADYDAQGRILGIEVV